MSGTLDAAELGGGPAFVFLETSSFREIWGTSKGSVLPSGLGLGRTAKGPVATAGVKWPSPREPPTPRSPRRQDRTGAAHHSLFIFPVQHGTLGSGRSSDKGPSWSSRSLGARCRNSIASCPEEQPHVGNYRLLRTIGKGNFAKVKLARHILTGREVSWGDGWGAGHGRVGGGARSDLAVIALLPDLR